MFKTQNITHVFSIWCMWINETAIAHVSHPGLYSKRKCFIFNYFMIKHVNKVNKVNKQQEVFIKQKRSWLFRTLSK